jgi:hypothetical protein
MMRYEGGEGGGAVVDVVVVVVVWVWCVLRFNNRVCMCMCVALIRSKRLHRNLFGVLMCAWRWAGACFGLIGPGDVCSMKRYVSVSGDVLY